MAQQPDGVIGRVFSVISCDSRMELFDIGSRNI
jgi:hypothetical protein